MTIKELQQYAKEQNCTLLQAADDCWCRLDERTRNAIGREAVYILAFLENENQEKELMEALYEYHEEIFEEEEGEE